MRTMNNETVDGALSDPVLYRVAPPLRGLSHGALSGGATRYSVGWLLVITLMVPAPLVWRETDRYTNMDIWI